MTSRCLRLEILTAACCAQLLFCGSQSFADNLTWNNAAGGLVSTPGNWTPAQVPNGLDTLFFGLNNTYTVSYNIAQSFGQRYNAGTVTIDLDVSHDCIGSFVVADNANNTATAILGFGAFEAQSVKLADESSSTATLTVGGILTDFTTTTSNIGEDGDGTLNVLTGATYHSNIFTVGQNATGIGVASINGVGSFQIPALLTSSLGTIGQSGVGELDILDGADAAFTGDLRIGMNPNSIGVVFINGGFSPPLSSLEVQGNVYVGSNTTAAVAGTGHFVVSNNASATIDGTTTIGDVNGGAGSGTLTLDAGGTLTTGSFMAYPNSDLILNGGRLVIDGGEYNPDGVEVTVDSPSSGGTVELRNNASVAGQIILIGNAELELTQDTQIVISTQAQIGTNNGDVGTLTIDSGTSLSCSAVLAGGVVSTGQGHVNVSGELSSANDVVLGSGASGAGFLDVVGPKALVEATGLQVGNAAGGDGFVTIDDGGHVLISDLPNDIIVAIHSGSLVKVFQDSVFQIDLGQLEVLGILDMQGGTADPKFINVVGEVKGHGTVDAALTFGSSAGVINASGGTLLLGGVNGASYEGLGGTLNVGSATVTINDQNGGAVLGKTTINGGVLNISNGSILSNATLSGQGTIRGSFTNNGTISSAGGGLVIDDGQLTSINKTINGTVITFDNGGTFSGTGTMACRVVGNAGSTLTPTGALTMGTATTTGVTLDGTLNVGPNVVTLIDSNGVGLGGLTVLNGGTLVQSVNVFTGVGDVLRGSGTAQSSLINGGVVQPGPSGGIGTLNVTGNLSHNLISGPGNTEIEVASAASADKLVVTGAASLGGDLIVKPISGFVPLLNQEFVVLTASSISGTFNSVKLLNAPPSLAAQAIISATQVKVKIIANPCPADVSPPGGNESIDVDDLLAIINAWGSCPALPAICSADVAPPGGNGFVNVDDLLAVINGWGGCP